MATALSWIFRLMDGVSGPADKMSKAIKGETDATDKAKSATDKLEESTDKLGKAHAKGAEHAESFRHRLFETVGLLREGAEMGERVVDFFADLGKEAIHAAGGAERSATSIKGLMGAAEGGEVLDYLENISKYTEFDDSDLRQLTIALADAGFEAKELQTAIPAALDIATLRGGGIGNAMGAVSVLERVKLSGSIDKRSLRKLGIEAKPFYDELGKTLGLTAKDAQDKAAAGGVDPEKLLNSLYGAISKKEGGPIGTLAIKGSQSLDALWSKLGKLKENLFEGLADGKAIGDFKGMLSNIMTVMDPSSEFGKSIVKSLDEILGDTFKSLFGDFSGPYGVDLLKEKINVMVADFKDAWPGIKEGAQEALETIKGIAKAMGAVAEVINAITPDIRASRSTSDIAGASVWDKIKNTGAGALAGGAVGGGAGFFAGGVGAIPGAIGGAVVGAGSALAGVDYLGKANDFIWRAGQAVEISPSDSIQGFKSGGSMGMGAYGSDSGGGRGGHSFSMGDISVNVTSAATDAAAVAREVSQQVREQVYSVFEQMATEAA